MNYLAVIVAAIVNMVIGYVWYGPLFGKQWLALSGKKAEDINRSALPRTYAWSFVAALVTAYVLARFIQALSPQTVLVGAKIGAGAWLGFVATVTAGSVLYEQRPFSLYALHNGYQLVSLLVMGAILTAWR